MIALSPSAAIVLREHKEKQEAMRLMLGKHLEDGDLVFSQPDGKPLLPDTVSHAWVKIVKRAGLKHFRLHDGRHTHASLLLKQNVHPKVVQERLGHATISTTIDLYSHVAPGLQEAAARHFQGLVRQRCQVPFKREVCGKVRRKNLDVQVTAPLREFLEASNTALRSSAYELLLGETLTAPPPWLSTTT